MIDKIRVLLLSVVISAVAFCSTIVSALPARPWAVETITTIPTQRLMNITAQFGGNASTTVGPNFGMLIWNAVAVYSDSMGMVAFVVMFAIPFLMMWIVQSDMTMPALLGMFFSLYLFARLPEQYIMFSVGCFVICITALLWSLYKRGY